MNIRDIARLADVTPGTVSKVLNNYPDISEATRQRILQIIKENQYAPKGKARAAKETSEGSRIGLVVESVYNSVYSELEDSISSRIYNSGCTIYSYHDNYYVQDKSEKLQELIANAEKEKLRGLIYIGGNFGKVKAELLKALPCPTVFINTVLPLRTDDTEYSAVQVNHFETAYAQMQYLIDKGHRNICTVITSFNDNSVYGQRTEGYKAALSHNRMEENLERFVEGRYHSEKAYENLRGYLEQHPEVTAVCCGADIMVPGVIRAIHDAGKTPGKDVEIISFDGLENTGYCIPTVTTFAQPLPEMINYTYELITGLLSGERTHQHVTFRSILRKGESC